MKIETITTENLRHMNDREGLILQGCGRPFEDWLKGINEELTEKGILLDGSKFESCGAFQHDNTYCLLFPFDGDVKLDMGKLAMWRIQTHEVFGGTWLSDYVENKLGGFTDQRPDKIKPKCPLIGADGNIYNLVGLASRTLKQNRMPDTAREMSARVFASGSYGEALSIIGEYVEITDEEDMDDDEDMGIDMS